METIEERERKKLLESTNWYRERTNNDTDEADRDKLKLKNSRDTWKTRKGKSRTKSHVNTIEVDGKQKLMSVLFVPHTEKSELAKRWRAQIEAFEKVGSLRFKIVERTGDKLTDLLHKSNDCERQDCLRQEGADMRGLMSMLETL